MKKTFKLILVSIFFFTSSVIFAQEINLTGGKIDLTGGNFFKGVEVKDPQKSCSTLFAYKSKGKVAVPVESRKFFQPLYESVEIANPLAQKDSSIVINDEIEDNSVEQVNADDDTVLSFKTEVVKPGVYSESTVKYRILNNFVPGPNYDTNVIPVTEEGEQSIIEQVVFIPKQVKQLSDKYDFVIGKDGDSIIPRDTLTLSGFFYVISDKPSKNPVDILTTETYISEKWGKFTQTVPTGKQETLLFSELCTRRSVPFIKTVDGKLLVPVAADGKALSSLNWILSKYFDIN